MPPAAANLTQTHRRASRARPWRTFTEWWHFAAEYLLMLPVGAAIALVWVNTDPEQLFHGDGCRLISGSAIWAWCCSSA